MSVKQGYYRARLKIGRNGYSLIDILGSDIFELCDEIKSHCLADEELRVAVIGVDVQFVYTGAKTPIEVVSNTGLALARAVQIAFDNLKLGESCNITINEGGIARLYTHIRGYAGRAVLILETEWIPDYEGNRQRVFLNESVAEINRLLEFTGFKTFGHWNGDGSPTVSFSVSV